MVVPREFCRPAFWLPLLVYLLYQVNARFGHFPLPLLLRAYLSDLLAMPVILTLALVVQRRWVHRRTSFILPDSWLLGAWLYISVWFELLLPLLSARHTGDFFDAVAYGLGTLFYRRFLNRPA
ncbi:magnesium citrate secondary transporter [Hymenobacter cellulosivorans]|uniref:Magnesium citrate secondary transporter n=1 Tax=Hymenobacter cellulosivorans TaxID=2932249 RepID=A0ABY4F611_9BACT|nr:magnesium citrate secondary transporter [Hymenobacter cellulosivorans]UOQ51973.1 magnesium citrate secondary transporter [Hymenobacter cellulosivorans]